MKMYFYMLFRRRDSQKATRRMNVKKERERKSDANAKGRKELRPLFDAQGQPDGRTAGQAEVLLLRATWVRTFDGQRSINQMCRNFALAKKYL